MKKTNALLTTTATLLALTLPAQATPFLQGWVLVGESYSTSGTLVLHLCEYRSALGTTKTTVVSQNTSCPTTLKFY